MVELLIKKEYAECYEIGKGEKRQPNDNELRVYCRQFPNVFCVQIRTFKPINGGWKKGKSRNMIAHVDLTISEIEQILEYAKNYKHTKD